MLIEWFHKGSPAMNLARHFDGRRQKALLFEFPFTELPSSHPWMQDLPGRLWPGARRQKALLFEFPARPYGLLDHFLSGLSSTSHTRK